MSSTAADSRGHVRQDSIAQKRSSPSKPRSGKPASLGVASIGSRGSSSSSSTPSGERSEFSMTPSLAIKTTLVALVLFAILHFLPASLSSSASSSNSSLRHEDRKALMDGSGEAWILPKRWREVGAGPGPVSLGGETLPECKRVMLYKFSDSHGFSSEIMHYLRALVIGQKLGYTVLADDSRWNYGSLSEYFLPRLVYCRPPVDWYDEAQAVKLGTKRWQSKDRVWVSRQMEKEMDEWVREEMLDQSTVAELKGRKMGTILPEGETLPSALEEVYTDFSGVLREVWRPNHQLAVLIRKQRMELGLGGGGLRHRKNSPNWGGRRRPGDRGTSSTAAAQDLAAEEEEFEQEYELHVAERSDRGPVVGVHLTSPKPRLSLSSYGLSSDAHSGNLTATLEGANDCVRRLSKSSIESPSYSRSRPTLFPATSTTTLVALTSSEALFEKFSAPGSGSDLISQTNQLYNVVRTSSPPVEELRQRWGDVLGGGGGGGGGGERSSKSILEEWDQKAWNELPRALKVELTRYFVRDLTTLSRFADAFVVAGSSPTGVLSVLLAGEEGAIGPRDFEGGSFGGRVRSIDGFWVPTSSVKTLYD